MHRKPYLSCMVAFALCAGVASQAQAARTGEAKNHSLGAASVSAEAIVVTDLSTGPGTADDLAQSLVGPGVSISNVNFIGDPAAAGFFAGGSGIIGFEEGVVLSSGRVADVVGPNTSDSITTSFGAPGDPDLDAISGFTTFDAAVLEFDFVPNTSVLAFSYVFSSEEYNEWVNTSFNDVFAFFVNGHNCAAINALPVTINTVNNGNPLGSAPNSNPNFYLNNDLDDGGGTIDVEMDGLTVVLDCQGVVTPNTVNHMKLAVADASDGILDTAVFIQAGSFVSAEQQRVYSPINPIFATPGGEFVLQVDYTTTDLNNEVTGLGLRVHFDSSKVQWSGYDSVFPTDLVGQDPAPTPDTDDFDGDPNTDMYLGLGWASASADWPGGPLPQQLASIRFGLVPGLAEGDSSLIQFSSASNAEGYAFIGTPVVVEASSCGAVSGNLDADGNGVADALTDGLLVIRYLFGFTGNALIDGAVAPDCTRCDAASIISYLNGMNPNP